MQTYSCFTLPLSDGRIGLVVVFKGFEEDVQVERFVGNLDTFLNTGEPVETLH